MLEKFLKKDPLVLVFPYPSWELVAITEILHSTASCIPLITIIQDDYRWFFSTHDLCDTILDAAKIYEKSNFKDHCFIELHFNEAHRYLNVFTFVFK